MTPIIIIAYIIGVVFTYILAKYYMIRDGNVRWTKGDRFIIIIISLLAPYVAGLILYGLSLAEDWEERADW